MNNSKMTSNRSNSKLELLVKLLKGVFYKKRLTVFIGSKGTTLTAYRFKKIKDTLYLEHNDRLRASKYRKFFKKHKRSHISFLLDNNECNLKHKIMPILRPMVKTNPIEHFITENYNSADIVGYYTYEVENKENEVWNNCIASTPFIAPVSDMIEYVVSASLKYNGVYFLSLEFHNIINKILLENNCKKYKNDLQIFATITQSSDIKIVIKHKQNILDEHRIECTTENKSIILGTIEHAITDKLAFYKEYIKNQNLKTCIILLVGKDLKKPSKKLNFNCDRLLVPKTENFKNDELQDHVLMDKFDETNAHPAFNQSLKAITKLGLFSKIIFKPLILIAVSLIIVTIILKSQSLITQAENSKLHKKYYSLSKQYRELSHSYPNNLKINDLVDLYKLEQNIVNNSVDFVKPIESIIAFKDPALKITNINWHNKNKDSSDLQIIIDFTYKTGTDALTEANNSINEYANYLQKIFPKYDIVQHRNQRNVTHIADITNIPTRIIIKKQKEGESDAR